MEAAGWLPHNNNNNNNNNNNDNISAEQHQELE